MIFRVSYALTIVASLTMAILFIVGIKIYKIVRNSNFVLLTMILCLTLNMAANVVFFSMNTIEYNPKNNFHGYPKTEWQIIKVLPITFLSMAVVINVRTWVYYHMRIGELANLT